ncbi:hypothetical protein BYT27DRAFT_7193708 [Phlegmacium glaucopus]|nr:hypothetical protein BYT27DRAFT_7193708 [Phlegmacium glaucopus]
MASPLSSSPSSSSTTPTPRIVFSNLTASSPTTPLPISTKSKSIPIPYRHHRGHSTSDLTDQPTVKVTSHGTPSSLPSSSTFNDGMVSTFRDRSRSPARVQQIEPEASDQSDHPLATSWWGVGEKHVARPWHDTPKKKATVPSEQIEALQSTRKRVAQAVVSALGTAADIAHETLYLGVEFLEFAPVPGLRPVAKLLLDIWDASQMVDMNRLGCLRLTERCADILISIREEIFEAGDVLGQELHAPILKLEEAYEGVHHFLVKQTSRPFLKRYLKRDEILRDIAACDDSLRDALGLFGISIQIRILRQVQETERRRQEDTRAFFNAFLTDRVPLPAPDSRITIENVTPPSSKNYQSEIVARFTTNENALGLFEDQPPSMSPRDLSPSQIIPAITSVHSDQNSRDKENDTADLRQLMRAALQTTSDAQMLEVLQIGHQEMPDAIKTLQRALEHVTQWDNDGIEAPPGKSVVLTKVVKKVSLKEGRGGAPKRSTTIISIDSLSTSSTGHSSERRRDTLDREFIESGIDALRRMSRGLGTSLPSWTITKYEVDRDTKIGIGFFSDVYRGTWRGQTVAIKVLAESTPRDLFVREIGIWKTLRHPNVLKLFGASSASGDPPWFFVSSYMKNGSIVEYLKRVELKERPSSSLGIGVGSTPMPLSPIGTRSPKMSLRSGTFPAPWTGVRRDLTPPGSRGRTPIQEDTAIHREWDLFRFMHEIAKGMEYLHSRGVLHGDLKGANVLVDDKYRCVISDFGLSEMKSEAYRISRTPLPHGTLRWQSPELMAGESQLTQEIDVWAFSICCVEILTMGRMPWPLADDDSVRHLVLKDDKRPLLPDNSRFNTDGLQDILRACWNTNPAQRPTFAKLVKDFKQLRMNSGHEIVDSPRIPVIDELVEISSPSPDMRPTLLPAYLQNEEGNLPNDVLPDIFQNLHQNPSSSDLPQQENTVSARGTMIPEPVIYTPVPSSRSSSIFIPLPQPEEPIDVIDYDGYDSPPPVDEQIANIRNERRYRLLLIHDYHPSLTLPLWDPSPVEVGAVGYLSKPRGHFVTLFNALRPGESKVAGIQSLPSIHGYGPTRAGTHRQDRRTVAQRGMDVMAGLLTFKTSSEKVARRYSYPLKAGHKMASLCTETTDYRYLEGLEAPKKWFQTHVDFIMQVYGGYHHIQKEDLFLVIGTLSAPNHALFVSHSHPEGHAHFSVYAAPVNGKPWGTFTTDKQVLPELGPSYDERDIISVQEIKVSPHGGLWNTVLLARLRFKPDVLEPTSK